MSIFRRIFGPRTSTPVSGELSRVEVEQIVNAYGKALESSPGMVRDSSELPYPKGRIKEALLLAIAMTTDERFREQLKTGYVELAGWQDGIGPGPFPWEVTPVDLSNPANHRKADVERRPVIVGDSKPKCRGVKSAVCRAKGAWTLINPASSTITHYMETRHNAHYYSCDFLGSGFRFLSSACARLPCAFQRTELRWGSPFRESRRPLRRWSWVVASRGPLQEPEDPRPIWAP